MLRSFTFSENKQRTLKKNCSGTGDSAWAVWLRYKYSSVADSSVNAERYLNASATDSVVAGRLPRHSSPAAIAAKYWAAIEMLMLTFLLRETFKVSAGWYGACARARWGEWISHTSLLSFWGSTNKQKRKQPNKQAKTTQNKQTKQRCFIC